MKNLNKKFHKDIDFIIEVQFTNGFSKNDFFTIGVTEEYNMSDGTDLQITFPESFDINFIFERYQILKINIYSSNGKKSEISINVAKIITNKLRPCSIPVDLLKGEIKEINDLNNEISANKLEKSEVWSQYLNINFQRITFNLDKKNYAFCIEYTLPIASKVSKRLRYQIITENYEGDKVIIYYSNELSCKNPLIFAVANFPTESLHFPVKDCDVKQDDIKRFILEFYEEDRYFGQAIIYPSEISNIIEKSEIGIFNVYNSESDITKSVDNYTGGKSKKDLINILKNNKSSTSLIAKSLVKNSLTQITSSLKANDSNENIEFNSSNKKKNEVIGKFKLKVEIRKKKRFLDYILEGMNVMFETAIDFTSSNLDPHHPNSLHTFNLENNKYEKAIRSCGNILQMYDSLQMFPVYGFGGVPYKGKEVSHCFNINSKKDPKIYGLDNVLEYYVESLKLVDMVGPTYFQFIIKNIVDSIKKEMKDKSSRIYHVFLILTDGKIEDMNETKHILVEASKMPLSIIIVGIGNADFGKMTELSKNNYK